MKVIALIMVTFSIFGCTNTTKVPKDILPRNKMELVLWDVIQAERFTSIYLLKDSASKNIQLEKFKLYDQVFNIHKVSREEFIKSYKYYLSRPDMAKVIFDSMSAKAERQKLQDYKGVSPK